ncbi:MAG: FAD-linked oxidase C-terminal domain-containing protein [Panacagrimonas sp.]
MFKTFVFRVAGSYEADLARWKKLKTRVSGVIVAHHGTIRHQPGVGLDHAPWLEAEKGALGMDLIRAAMRELDPQGMVNPGKLLA